MRETRIAVVVSEEQGEVDRFRRQGLDIIPHRRLIKEGMDLPESMRSRQEYHNMQRIDLDDAFKAVPCLSTLYLDKPLKAHTLMQAIARAVSSHG
jgi:type I restriction enzyme R subunit